MSKKNANEKEMLKVYIEKLNDLYVLLRKRWVKLDTRGSYSTKKRPKDRVLIDFDLEAHLKGYYTVNVFSGKTETKFICFDVDEKDDLTARWKVQKLIYTMNNLGIPQKYIITSLSGNKGYHVELFFNRIVSIEMANWFYDLVINNSGLDNKVEFRPTAKQSIKIPLGWNFRNTDIRKRECHYVDPFNYFKPFGREYVLTIEKIDANIIMSLLYDACEELTNQGSDRANDDYKAEDEDVIIENTSNAILKPNFHKGQDVPSTAELEDEDIECKGTRHNKLKKLTLLYKNVDNLDSTTTKEKLIKYMEKQNPWNYSTSWREVLREIDNLVKYAYEFDYGLPREYSYNSDQFFVTDREVERVLEVKSKNGKLLLCAMLIHSKKYVDKNGIFYMTYKQMSKSTGLSDSTCKRHIKELSELGFIVLVDVNRKVKGTYKKGTNYYSLSGFDNLLISKCIPIVGNEDSRTVFQNSLELLDESVLKSKLNRTDYSKIKRNVYYKH
jgi:hypothetical protein